MQVVLDQQQIEILNESYRPLSIEDRIQKLYEDFTPEKIMLTSSFATTSAFLLSMFAKVRPEQVIYFIDTGYHFPETLHYKEELTKRYGLKVKSIQAAAEDHDFTTRHETWKENPEYCCFLNKVHPLEIIKSKYDIWVSGLMRWQSDHRATLDIFEERKGIIKFYPLIDVTRGQRTQYFQENDLPIHPLVPRGYASIGCTHCTAPGEDRTGRWNNNPKTECGLHL